MRRWRGGLLDELAGELRLCLGRASELARRLEIDLYVVGGAVRDLLLDEPQRDLDLVWEGSREPKFVASAFGEAFGARASYRPEFLTAGLVLPGGARLDLGRARAETYPAAASLPKVHSSSLVEDLRRRDFSVNAMAVCVTAPEKLIDPCGGWGDLAARQLRILHPSSFRDDPTRILRGCELAVRRGLGFETTTSAKISEAILAGYPALPSGPRIRHELERLLGSPRRAAPGARMLRALGMDVALHPEFEIEAAGPARLERLEAWRAGARGAGDRGESPDVEFWLVALGALLWRKPSELRRRLASWLHLSRGERDWLERVPERLAPLLEPAQAVESALEDMATLYAGLSPAEAQLAELLVEERYREGLRAVEERARIELGISGEDLLAAGVAPGPGVGEALAATLAALRSREISPEDELAFALGWLARKAGADAP